MNWTNAIQMLARWYNFIWIERDLYVKKRNKELKRIQNEPWNIRMNGKPASQAMSSKRAHDLISKLWLLQCSAMQCNAMFCFAIRNTEFDIFSDFIIIFHWPDSRIHAEFVLIKIKFSFFFYRVLKIYPTNKQNKHKSTDNERDWCANTQTCSLLTVPRWICVINVK